MLAYRFSFAVLNMDAVQRQRAEVRLEMLCVAETLDEGDGAAAGTCCSSGRRTPRLSFRTARIPEELRAAGAHEVEHDYLWTEYRTPARLGDPGRLQEVELRCDAVAVFILLYLGMDTAALLEGVSKQAAFNELVGATANPNCYVSRKDRTNFVQALIDRVADDAGRLK